MCLPLLCCSLLALAAPMAAQTTQGLIRGRVYDRTTGQPLASAYVTYSLDITGGTGGARADSQGFY